MKRKAYGKINLGLNVLRKREDGYHDLRMVMVPVDLFDTVEITDHTETVVESNKWYIPLYEKNTVYQALKLMHEKYGTPMNLKVKLVKNIPTQAGMAGGSSDAATVINMLNERYHLNLSDQELIDIGVQIGADVPFCLFNKPAIVTGIGEKLEFIDIYDDFYLFLVKPNFGINTGMLFNSLKVKEASSKEFDALVQGLTQGDYSLIQSNLINDLQDQAVSQHPEIKQIIDELIKFGFDNACMTGSGSVVFGITQNEQLARNAVLKFFRKYPLVKKSKIVRQ